MDTSRRLACILRVREKERDAVTSALFTVVCCVLAAKHWNRLTWSYTDTQLAFGMAFSSVIASSVLER